MVRAAGAETSGLFSGASLTTGTMTHRAGPAGQLSDCMRQVVTTSGTARPAARGLQRFPTPRTSVQQVPDGAGQAVVVVSGVVRGGRDAQVAGSAEADRRDLDPPLRQGLVQGVDLIG